MKFSINYNFYEIGIILIINTLLFGLIGNSLQIGRILSIVLLPINIIFWFKNKVSLKIFLLIFIGLFWLITGYILLSKAFDKNLARIYLLYLFLNFNLIFSLILFGTKTTRLLEIILKGWLLFIIISIFFGSFEIITGIHFFTNHIQADKAYNEVAINGIVGKKYAAFTYGNYNEYMTALSMSVPFLFTSLLYFKNYKAQKKLLIISFIVFSVIALTSSRGAILAFIIGLAIFMFFYKKINFDKKKTLIKRTKFSLILGILFLSPLILSQLLARLDSQDLTEDQTRILMYAEILSRLENSNYKGIGPDGLYSLNLPPHNLWLDIAVQYGILILIILIIFFVYVISYIFIKSKYDLNYKYLFLSAYLIILPVSLINSSYLNYPFTWIFVGSLITLFFNYSKNNKLSIYYKK